MNGETSLPRSCRSSRGPHRGSLPRTTSSRNATRKKKNGGEKLKGGGASQLLSRAATINDQRTFSDPASAFQLEVPYRFKRRCFQGHCRALAGHWRALAGHWPVIGIVFSWALGCNWWSLVGIGYQFHRNWRALVTHTETQGFKRLCRNLPRLPRKMENCERTRGRRRWKIQAKLLKLEQATHVKIRGV